MSRDLAFYRRQPYQRVWETRHDAGERYFLVRINEFPRVIGDGASQAEAVAHLREAFDDFITWRLEDGLAILEPARGLVLDEQPTVSLSWAAVTLESDVPGAAATPCTNVADREMECPVSAAVGSRHTSQPVHMDALTAAA
jgi:predicted RNase H-like HicB family nuclease